MQARPGRGISTPRKDSYGMNLSTAIIIRGHSGELKVNTEAGEGAVFIISIPMNQQE